VAHALGMNHRFEQYFSRLGRSAGNRLDDVDFGWEVAGDFETNFLLTNLRLAPNFHGILSSG
jgi:hypothetical protein